MLIYSEEGDNKPMPVTSIEIQIERKVGNVALHFNVKRKQAVLLSLWGKRVDSPIYYVAPYEFISEHRAQLFEMVNCAMEVLEEHGKEV